MKNKLIQLDSGDAINSCGVCHPDTINAKWCHKCLDAPDISKYTLNPVQVQVLELTNNNINPSFVVSTKTGTGKTLCAYIAIRSHFENNPNGKVIWTSPLKQIAREKIAELPEQFPDKNLLELTGDTIDDVGTGAKRNAAIRNADIIVTSQEMLDSLSRKPDIYTAINDITMIVIDEIHGLGDPNRGGKFDGALTRYLLRMKRLNRVPQIVALSATFDNISDLKRYFKQFVDNFTIISSTFTPIKSNVDDKVHTYSRSSKNLIMNELSKYMDTPGGILVLQLTIPGTKKICDEINTVYGAGTAITNFSEMDKQDRIDSINEFNQGKYKVLCATPTVLAGVNISCTVIILNVTFFNSEKMELDVLPPSSIRQACLPSGEKILTNNGCQSIELLRNNDLVLTHNGEFRRVVTPLERSYSGPIVTIYPQYMPSMSMTPEHKVLIVTGKRMVETKGTRGRSNYETRHVWRYSSPYWTDASKLYDRDGPKRMYVLFPRLQSSVDVESLHISDDVGGNATLFSSKDINLTDDALFFFGCYVAEGSATKEGRIALSYGYDDKSYPIMDELERIIPTIFPGVNVGEREITNNEGRSSPNVVFHSIRISKFLHELFGDNAHNKHIPDMFLNLPSNRLKHFIKGLWLGDGSNEHTYSESKNYRGIRHRYSTVSYALANQIIIILTKLGYMPSFKHYKRTGGFYKDAEEHDIYLLNISGEQAIKFSSDVMKFSLANELNYVSGRNRTYNIFHMDSRYIYIPIKKVVYSQYAGKVYNLEVSDDKSYTGSFIVHNSGRVGRPPNFNEGWVSYIADEKILDKVNNALDSPNTITGAMISAIHTVLNIEVSLKATKVSELREWFDHSYSGISMESTDRTVDFNDAIKFLIENGYVILNNDVLHTTRKGRLVARNFIDPIFFEHTIKTLSGSAISNTELLISAMSDLFTHPKSPIAWTKGKLEHTEKCFNLDWMRDRANNYIYNLGIKQGKINWASNAMFMTDKILNTLNELELWIAHANMEIIHNCLAYGIVPIPLINIGKRLEQLGIKFNINQLFYLYVNGVRLSETGVITGPVNWRTPTSATFNIRTDTYDDVSFTSLHYPYFDGIVQAISKHYNEESTSDTSDWLDTLSAE